MMPAKEVGPYGASEHVELPSLGNLSLPPLDGELGSWDFEALGLPPSFTQPAQVPGQNQVTAGQHGSSSQANRPTTQPQQQQDFSVAQARTSAQPIEQQGLCAQPGVPSSRSAFQAAYPAASVPRTDGRPPHTHHGDSPMCQPAYSTASYPLPPRMQSHGAGPRFPQVHYESSAAGQRQACTPAHSAHHHRWRAHEIGIEGGQPALQAALVTNSQQQPSASLHTMSGPGHAPGVWHGAPSQGAPAPGQRDTEVLMLKAHVKQLKRKGRRLFKEMQAVADELTATSRALAAISGEPR